MLGGLDEEDAHARALVRSVGCAVVMVAYRLAPEHPYPAAIEDAHAALVWLDRNASDLGIDPARIAIGGVSAGGGLAAALALFARERGLVRPVLQVLMCPMLDDRAVTPSSAWPMDPRLWTRESNAIAWRMYLGARHGHDVPSTAAPARAADLRDLPAAYISVGTSDLFLDEDLDFARRLVGAGVATALHVYAGAFHGFEFSPRCRKWRCARSGSATRLFA